MSINAAPPHDTLVPPLNGPSILNNPRKYRSMLFKAVRETFPEETRNRTTFYATRKGTPRRFIEETRNYNAETTLEEYNLTIMKSGQTYIIEGYVRTMNTNEYDNINGLVKTIPKRCSRHPSAWELGALSSLPYLNSRLVRIEEELRQMRETPLLIPHPPAPSTEAGIYSNPHLPTLYPHSPALAP